MITYLIIKRIQNKLAKSKRKKLWRTCIHESGHAIVGEALNHRGKLLQIRIYPENIYQLEGIWEGYTKFESPKLYENLNIIEVIKEIIVLYAGVISEKIILSINDLDEIWKYAEGDHRKILKLLEILNIKENMFSNLIFITITKIIIMLNLKKIIKCAIRLTISRSPRQLSDERIINF